MDHRSASSASGTRMLTDAELLMLDMLIYHVCPEMGIPGTSVRALAEQVEQHQRARMDENGATLDAAASNNMTYGEWIDVMHGIQADPALGDLVLDVYASDERDARMGCFVDARGDDTCGDRDSRGGVRGGADCGNAYVAFAGTGVGEWMDNCLAGYSPDTKQQVRAFEWLTSDVIPRGYATLTLSGHSKGGNKAMYCGVRAAAEDVGFSKDAGSSDTAGVSNSACASNDAGASRITRVVSFDGQGFSKTFIANYHDEIDAFQSKVTWYASDADPVNGLCFPIVPAEHCHYLTHAPELDKASGSMIRFHAPLAMMEKSPESPCGYRLRPEGPQAESGKASSLLMNYMVSHLEPDLFEQFCFGVGMIVDNVVPSKKSPENRRRDLLTASQTDAFAIAVNAFAHFLSSIGHPMTVRALLELILPQDIAGDMDLDVLASRIEKVTSQAEGGDESLVRASAQEAHRRLAEGNAAFVGADRARGNVSPQLRQTLVDEGQHPLAVIVTCSDARVVPDYVFDCSLGDLFTIRAVGGEVDEAGIASVVYACDHLGVKLVVELGHTHCGAVDTAVRHTRGDLTESPTLRPVVERVAEAIGDATDAREAEVANVCANVARIRANEEVQHLMATAGVRVEGALYHTDSGKVEFLEV